MDSKKVIILDKDVCQTRSIIVKLTTVYRDKQAKSNQDLALTIKKVSYTCNIHPPSKTANLAH